MKAKIYTDGINRVGGIRKGDLPKSFHVLARITIENEKELKSIEKYGNCIVKYYNNISDKNSEDYVFFAKELHIGCLDVEANRKTYNYQQIQ